MRPRTLAERFGSNRVVGFIFKSSVYYLLAIWVGGTIAVALAYLALIPLGFLDNSLEGRLFLDFFFGYSSGSVIRPVVGFVLGSVSIALLIALTIAGIVYILNSASVVRRLLLNPLGELQRRREANLIDTATKAARWACSDLLYVFLVVYIPVIVWAAIANWVAESAGYAEFANTILQVLRDSDAVVTSQTAMKVYASIFLAYAVLWCIQGVRDFIRDEPSARKRYST